MVTWLGGAPAGLAAAAAVLWWGTRRRPWPPRGPVPDPAWWWGAATGMATGSVVAAVGGALVVLAAARWWRRRQEERRRAKLAEQLPGWLELVAVHLAAGRNVHDAIRDTIGRLPEPLRTEVWRTLCEAELRADHREALRRLGERLATSGGQAAAATLERAWDQGPVPDLLERQAAVVRELRQHAAVARTRLLPLWLSILPSVLVVDLLALFLVPLGYQLVNELGRL